MSGIDEASAFLVEAQAAADNLLALARLRLGAAIQEARDDGTPQKDIADHLGLTREQVRRLTVAARGMSPKELSDEVRAVRNLLMHGPMARRKGSSAVSKSKDSAPATPDS